jgi:hypothetical protein
MTAYMLLDDLADREHIRVADALNLTPLAMARGGVAQGDRLVVVTRDLATANAGVTVNAWRRARRAVWVISPTEALTFDVRTAIPDKREPMPVMAEAPKSGHGRPITERLDMTHVGLDWRLTTSHADARPTCCMCGRSISPAKFLTSGDLHAHALCRDLAAGDLARLNRVPRGGVVEPTGERRVCQNERRSLRRLAAGGYLTASEVDGVVTYKRAKAQVGG